MSEGELESSGTSTTEMETLPLVIPQVNKGMDVMQHPPSSQYYSCHLSGKLVVRPLERLGGGRTCSHSCGT